MSYVITKTDGTTLATVAENSINTSTDIALIGKNYFNYGAAQNQNFVKLLENFSNSSAPTAPITGQLWYDKTTTVARLKVYDGSRFKEVGSAIVAASAPSYWKEGDFWLNSATGQLYVNSRGTDTSAAARLIGPVADPGKGTNGLTHTSVTDTLSAQHQAVNLYVASSRIAIANQDGTYTPSPSISGFPQIVTGITVNSAAQIYLASNDGLLVGTSAQGQVKAGSGTVTLANTATSGKVYLEAKTAAGAANTILAVDGATQRVGINTTSPGAALDVAGSVRTNTGFTSTNNNGLTLGASGTGTISLSSNNLVIANSTVAANIILWPVAGNVLIGGATGPASGNNSLVIYNGAAAPAASVTNAVVLYAEDVAASSELKVRDEAGNITTLSPHNFSLIPEGPSEPMAWSYYSENNGTKINVDMLKLARLLERLTGEKLVYTEGK